MLGALLALPPGAIYGAQHLRLGNALRRGGSELLPDVIVATRNSLQNLDLSGSGLGDSGAASLARGLSGLAPFEGLHVLNLSGCDISPAGASALLSTLREVTPALRALRASGNYGGKSSGWGLALAAALPYFGALSILDVEGTMLWDAGVRALATALPCVPSLCDVGLARVGIGEAAAGAVGAALASLPRLRRVDLCGNFLWAAGVAALAGALAAGAPALEVLLLGDNACGDDGAVALAAALPGLGGDGRGGGIVGLDLSNNGVGEAGAAALAAALPSLFRLSALDLCGNPRIGHAGVAALAASLRGGLAVPHFGRRAAPPAPGVSSAAPAPGVSSPPPAGRSTSSLSTSAFGYPGDDEDLAFTVGGSGGGGRASAASAGHWRRRASTGGGPAYALTLLDLSGCGVAAEGVVALATSLGAAPRLASLRLADNACGNTGAAAICGATGILTGLGRLELGGNRLGDAAAQEIAGVLTRLPALTALGLGRNQIGPPGVRALAAALSARAAPRLTRLDLSGAALSGATGEAAACALADALRGTPLLSELDLSHCGLGPPTARALADTGGGLELLRHLSSLRLRGNALGDAGVSALARVLCRGSSPELARLDLADNGVGDAGGAEVGRARCALLRCDRRVGFSPCRSPPRWGWVACRRLSVSTSVPTACARARQRPSLRRCGVGWRRACARCMRPATRCRGVQQRCWRTLPARQLSMCEPGVYQELGRS